MRTETPRACSIFGKPYISGLIVLLLAGLLTAGYYVENWRGERAWRACSETQGMAAPSDTGQTFGISPIPRESNVWTAPVIAEWFGLGPGAGTLDLDAVFASSDHGSILAEVKVLPLKTEIAPQDHDLTFLYPVDTVDPQLPVDTKKQLLHLLEQRFVAWPTNEGVQKLRAAGACFDLFSDTPATLFQAASLPARILIRSDDSLAVGQVDELVRMAVYRSGLARRVRTAKVAPGQFRVYAAPPLRCAAEDYMALTGVYEDDFESMREALQRPSCEWDNNNRPNYIALRVVPQMLAQRAQAYLLTSRPEEALRELRLAHDLTRLVQNEVCGAPTTLLGAMARFAVLEQLGVVVEEGVSLGQWKEQELAELQNLLAGLHLAAEMSRTMSLERAENCRALEAMRPETVPISRAVGGPPSLFSAMKPAAYWIVKLAPRGWVYQNMASVAEYWDCLTDAYDAKQDRLEARSLEAVIMERWSRFKPYTELADYYVRDPNVIWKSVVTAQATVDHAVTACALERYRKEKGTYPQALEGLVPDYLTKLRCDLLTGRPHEYVLLPSDKFRRLSGTSALWGR